MIFSFREDFIFTEFREDKTFAKTSEFTITTSAPNVISAPSDHRHSPGAYLACYRVRSLDGGSRVTTPIWCEAMWHKLVLEHFTGSHTTGPCIVFFKFQGAR